MKPTKKIKFLIDVEIESQGEISFKAKAGEVVELSAASANHWLKRNKAALHIQAKPKPVIDKPTETKTTVKKANAKPKAAAAKTVDK
jgi:hypothetical protein